MLTSANFLNFFFTFMKTKKFRIRRKTPVPQNYQLECYEKLKTALEPTPPNLK